MSSTSRMRGTLMLDFRYTCSRHQQMFIDIAQRGGCRDPEQMDAVGRKTLAWLSDRYPRMVLDHFNEQSCLGCKLEANLVSVEEIVRTIAELSAGVALSQCQPETPSW